MDRLSARAVAAAYGRSLIEQAHDGFVQWIVRRTGLVRRELRRSKA